jgi:ring-1,2-phenylacetyl-CoA epoxidase subunit PaaB
MLSLDPRVNRLPPLQQQPIEQAVEYQLYPYEVFVKAKEGKPFQHEGNVRASDLELAFILAKETFTRRFTCHSLCVVATEHIWISKTTDHNQNVYHQFPAEFTPSATEPLSQYAVYHLLKRGKQHVHAGDVNATSITHAQQVANALFGKTTALNVWIIPEESIRYTSQTESDLWNTLSDKKYRDAIDYKGGDLLQQYLMKKQE